MKQFIFFLTMLLYLIPFPGFPLEGDLPRRWTISGIVTDISNGENLPGATIYIPELKTGTVTDIAGKFSISLPQGAYTVQFSYVGFTPIIRSVELTRDISLELAMEPSKEILKEVVVTSEQANKNVTRAEMSTFKMDMKTIQRIPSLMGEVDIIKVIQMLPGVQPVSEGGSGFIVRGGGADQNLILLDESTVYNASHQMGFFSVFNNDAIQEVKLYKGDIPPSYGGRLSSVLDVRMKEGNPKRYEVGGGIGLISSRLTVEGPIRRERASFILSARRSYIDLFASLSNHKGLRDNKLYFYDVNAKVHARLNEKNTLSLSGYFGRDVFRNPFFRMRWGNATGTIQWNHVFTKKLFGHFTFIYSDYRYSLATPDGTAGSFEWISGMTDAGLRGNFSYYLNKRNTLHVGLSTVYHRINPGLARGLGSETAY